MTRVQAVLRAYRACAAVLDAALAGVSPEALAWSPAPESRGMGDICRHLIRVDGWLLRRCGIEPAAGDATTGAREEIAAGLGALRAQVEAAVAACADDAELLAPRPAFDGGGEHRLGPVVLHMAQHYLYHSAQLVYLRRARDRGWAAPLEEWEKATHVLADLVLE